MVHSLRKSWTDYGFSSTHGRTCSHTMKRFALLFSALTLGLTLASSLAQEAESELVPHRWYGREFDLPTMGGDQALYYRPTMRYYGNGYTVSYRYVPVFKSDSIYIGGIRGSSNFPTEAFRIQPDEIPSWGTTSPRLTVKDPRSTATRTAVTTIVRKKTTKTKVETDSTEVPALKP